MKLTIPNYRLIGIAEINLDTIEQYNSFWRSDHTKTNWSVSLFEGYDSVDIRQYIPEQSFKKFEEDDSKIIGFVEDKDYSNMLLHINKIYHCRVTGIDTITKNEEVFMFLRDDSEEKSIDSFIALCKKDREINEYSFSSKVFSFMYPKYVLDKEKYPNRKGFPIIDSYVVSLLKHFLNVKSTTKWGRYDEFVKSYNMFIDTVLKNSNECKDKEVSYKMFDVFLWTYAKAVSNFWNHAGVFQPVWVQYRP